MPAINDVIRIGIADDDFSVCQLLSDHVNTIDKCKVVLQAASGVELLTAMKKNAKIDMVILDIMMPFMNGYETANYIRKHYPAIKILFYSVSRKEEAIHLMLECGGHGLIPKGKDKAEIRKAINAVLKGEYYYPISNEFVKINNRGGQNNKLWQNGISDTELIFLRYAATEMPYKEMAANMKMEER